jgi:formylglycine-generating enzyme required for sulfatase activity/CheY-like chemotaxis protein
VKILLVDDDAGVIQALLPELKSIPDAEVRVATTGEKALEHAMEWGALDVLVTEVIMEPMNGFTLRNKIDNRISGVRTIFISGYDLSGYAEFIGSAQVLSKPIVPDDLRDAVIRQPAPSADTAVVPAPVLQSAPQTRTPPVPKVVAVGGAGAPQIKVPQSGTPVTAKAAPAAGISGAGLVGQTLGNYKILRLLGEGKWGSVYEALQISMNRPVALKVLAPKLQQNPANKEQFIADARAKARVQHPLILSVYEAGEAGPYCYYTIEHVDGSNLPDYILKGGTVDDPLALQLIRVAAEGLSHLNLQKISHTPIDADNLYVGADNRPRLGNLATQQESHPETQREILSLSQIVRKALPNGQASDPGLQGLLHRMSVPGGEGFLSWGALLQAVKALEPKVVPKDALQMSAQDVAAIRAVEESKRRQKRSLIMYCAASLVMLSVLLGLTYAVFFRTNERDIAALVEIPGGDFIYQDGEKMNLPTFWIDKYEVTIGQYAKFLAFIKNNPGEERQYEHPAQPRGKSHTPKDWDVYYGRAKAALQKYRNAKGIPIDLNCPVFGVDWWDAYAYAKWRGRRLPSEQEWEKAARGTDGFLYPWGNEFDPKKCNSASDYNIDPRIGGKIDGYAYWSPVDALTGDCSPYNVYGMAGNLSEWTDSWDISKKYPIIRGGSFHSVDKDNQPDVKTTKRYKEAYPEEVYEYLGFRTATSEPPKK